MTAARRLAAILAADVVGYSRLMGEDEAGTARARRPAPCSSVARRSIPATLGRRSASPAFRALQTIKPLARTASRPGSGLLRLRLRCGRTDDFGLTTWRARSSCAFLVWRFIVGLFVASDWTEDIEPGEIPTGLSGARLHSMKQSRASWARATLAKLTANRAAQAAEGIGTLSLDIIGAFSRSGIAAVLG
jgi:hypothetical protein